MKCEVKWRIITEESGEMKTEERRKGKVEIKIIIIIIEEIR